MWHWGYPGQILRSYDIMNEGKQLPAEDAGNCSVMEIDSLDTIGY